MPINLQWIWRCVEARCSLVISGNLVKRIFSSFLILLLVACAGLPVTETPVMILSTKIIPTITALPPSPTPSVRPSITPIQVEVACDPFHADFCISDGHFLLQRPIQPPGNDLVDPSYRYASTANGTRDPHHGVEFPNPSGTPVLVAADGVVLFAGADAEAIYAPWQNFYGNLVVVQHKDELFTLYAHLSKINVAVGQQLFAGEKVGEVGSTGGAIGSHLHFEVRRGDVQDYFATQNPELWLLPPKDENGHLFGTLMISIVDEKHTLAKHAELTLGYHSDPSQPPLKIYYGTVYSSDLLTGEENAMFGELSAGLYRIAVESDGQILERWAEVESGKRTQVVFVVN
jgi:hypothetical protein